MAEWRPALPSKRRAEGKINLTIAGDIYPQVFWPWRAEEIVDFFNSCPAGTYSMEVWDVYIDGVFQRTEYNIHAH